jgi:hypothetical protein
MSPYSTINLHYPLVPLEELHDSISSGDVEAKSSIDMLVDHYIDSHCVSPVV